jgi:fucokinase
MDLRVRPFSGTDSEVHFTKLTNGPFSEFKRTMWDYLILTASNERQAAGYEGQLEVRRRAGLLAEVRSAMVVADPQGKRVGSGGSTLYCLMRVVESEMQRTGRGAGDWAAIESLLRGVRVLILHAGGDSRRVPAYGPCGKIFSPVPGESHGEVISTLFDRLYPIFRDMPGGPAGAGQVIVGAGDALPLFDARALCFDRPGMVALGAYAAPEAASKHGVFCIAPDGQARLFLQKPTPDVQRRLGTIDAAGRSVLDIGVMSFDAATALAMFRAFDVRPTVEGPRFSAEMENRVLDDGLDIYREICCALGSEATAELHRASSVASGSHWPAGQLAEVYNVLTQVPLSAVVLPQCEFLHFGTTWQLIYSGSALGKHDGRSFGEAPISLNNRLTDEGRIVGGDSWVEGCVLKAPLNLAGLNVVVGADIDSPVALPVGACLDVIAGEDRTGRKVWFVRTYHIADTFKDPIVRGSGISTTTGCENVIAELFKEPAPCGGTLTGRPLGAWLAAVGVLEDEIWAKEIAPASRSLWNARVFPAVESSQGYLDWLWMFDPATASTDQKQAFLDADRYSVAEIALLADMDAFYARRSTLCDTP